MKYFLSITTALLCLGSFVSADVYVVEPKLEPVPGTGFIHISGKGSKGAAIDVMLKATSIQSIEIGQEEGGEGKDVFLHLTTSSLVPYSNIHAAAVAAAAVNKNYRLRFKTQVEATAFAKEIFNQAPFR